jgi:hypothetical protein
MTTWQQTLMPSLIFYGLAAVVAMAVAALISGLGTVLHHLENKGKEHSK